MKKWTISILLLGMFFFAFSLVAQNPAIIRGPYVQKITQTSGVIRWRTDQPSSSQITVGEKLHKQNRIVKNEAKVIDHELEIHHLSPNQKYYYSIGSTEKLEAASSEQFIKTIPKTGSTQAIRIWALGDFGAGTENQKLVKDALINYVGDKKPDAWIWLGDNAYNNGKDDEYQQNVFNIYQKDFLQNTALYPSPGNHDYAGKHDSSLPPYFQIFTLPTKGETGGVPSGTESYYSVDYGNVHLISLNTEEMNTDGTYLFDGKGAQAEWLIKDLEANKLPWVIAYFHKPPYTKGSHDSDFEKDLILMRKNVTPIFEKYKVDVVIAGHSHVYERTYALQGHTELNKSFDPNKHIVESKKGENKYVVDNNGQGVIYVVCGSGGKVGGKQKEYPLNAAIYSNNQEGGSMIFDIKNRTLMAKWIASNGKVLDQFSIQKK
ncbi:purple acid phosphatase family protein [Aquirufa sp. ROCK2-A2]